MNLVNKICYPLLLLIITGISSNAQNSDCIFKDTLFRIDFGNAKTAQEFNLRSLVNYRRAYSNCPEDGYYSYSSETTECFKGDWITLTEDHTPNDIGGKMFFVNANPSASAFFIATLSGFKTDTKYEFGVWMMNLCKINGGCSPLPPNILITLQTPSGKKIASFQTGRISSSANPSWKKYFAFFTTPADATALNLKMEDITNGGCGNDFVMDDITFRECYKKEMPPPVAEIKPATVIPKPQPKEPAQEQLKKYPVKIANLPAKDSEKVQKTVSGIKPVNIILPQAIQISMLIHRGLKTLK